MQVNCVLHTPSLTAPLCSYFINTPITPDGLIAAFPYEGEFVFRMKVSAIAMGMEDTDYFWLDISHKAAPLTFEELSRLAFNPSLLELQVTPLFKNYEFVDYEVTLPDDEYTRYLSESRSHIAGLTREPSTPIDYEEPAGSSKKGVVGELFKQISKAVHKHASQSSSSEPEDATNAHDAAGIVPLDLKQVKKSVTSIWKAVKSVTSSIAASAASSSSSLAPGSALSHPDVQASLQSVFNYMNVAFSHNNPQHMDLLRDLYDCTVGVLCPGAPFEHQSDRWKTIGFQKDDPLLDVKTTGLLFLHSLRYFCQQYATDAGAMMQRHTANVKTNYPFAIVGVNLTLLLIEVFQIRDQKYLTSSAGYWDVFVAPTAFYEIFCLCFGHLDRAWTQRRATRAEFGAVIGEVKESLQRVLAHNPKSLEDVRFMAQAESMFVLGM